MKNKVLYIACGLAFTKLPICAAGDKEHPNILMILVDDL